MKDLMKENGNKDRFTLEGIHYESGKPVSIEIIDGVIGKITETEDIKKENNNIFIAPGLIDNQINGYAGIDFSGDNLTVNDFIIACKAILKDGVTSFLPTLITNSHVSLIKNFGILAKALEKEEWLAECIPGFILKVHIFHLKKGTEVVIRFSISENHHGKNFNAIRTLRAAGSDK
jgi:N-acetylglucosamine-6-phosphate deacetylase